MEADLQYGEIIPQAVIASTGEVYTLFCKSFSIPTWDFVEREGDIKHRLEVTTQKIDVTVTDVKLNGKYQCRGTYLDGKKFLASSYLFVAG